MEQPPTQHPHSMGDRLDPRDGTVYVQLDLRKDILNPLKTLEEKVTHLDERHDEHVRAHELARAKREERKETLKRTAKWAAGGVASIAASALAAHFGGVV